MIFWGPFGGYHLGGSPIFKVGIGGSVNIREFLKLVDPFWLEFLGKRNGNQPV